MIAEKLKKYATQRQESPYREGINDCATFVAGWVDLISGTTTEATLRESYRSKIEGLRTWKPADGPTTVAAMARPFLIQAGWVEIPKDGGLLIGDVLEMKNTGISVLSDLGPVTLLPSRILGIGLRQDISKIWRFEGKENS